MSVKLVANKNLGLVIYFTQIIDTGPLSYKNNTLESLKLFLYIWHKSYSIE